MKLQASSNGCSNTKFIYFRKHDSLNYHQGSVLKVLCQNCGYIDKIMSKKHAEDKSKITCDCMKVIRLQRSGIDTIKYHTWPRIPMGKWQTHRRHHKREPRGQPFPSRWPQSTYKQTRTKHSKHKTEQKHKRSTKENNFVQHLVSHATRNIFSSKSLWPKRLKSGPKRIKPH